MPGNKYEILKENIKISGTSHSLIIFAILLITISFTNLSSAQVNTNKKNNSNSISSLLNYGKQFEQSNPDSAWFYYEKAHQLALKNNNNVGLSDYFSHAIVLLNNAGKFEEALGFSNKTIDLGQELKDTVMLIKGFNNSANEYEYLGQFLQASRSYMEAIRLADKIGNKIMQQKLDNNIASVFIELKDYKKANEYADKAYSMTEIVKDTAEIGSILINLGVTELHLGKYDSALVHFNKAIIIGKYVNDITLVADAKLNLGDIYSRQNMLNKASKEYSEVKHLAEKLNLPDYNLYSLFSLALIKQKQLEFVQASRLTRKAITIGERIGAAIELREMYDTLSVLLEKTGDLKGSLVYRKKYEALSNSLLNARVRTSINSLQIQYQAAKKDKQIAEQNLQLEKNSAIIRSKNTLLTFLTIGLIGLTILILLSYRFYHQRQKLQEQRELNFRKERELLQLKAVMKGREEERKRISAEIHDDIGSSLTAIIYMTNNLNDKDHVSRLNAIDKIKSTASNVVEKMNEIIWSMNKDYDSLDDLITYIRYHAVELLECSNIEYRLNIPENIPLITISGEQRRNVYLAVKETLHNIIKHSNATKAEINFEFINGLQILIHDNGKGFDINNSRKFGNGLKNMQNRINSIKGHFSIKNDEGTTIKLEIPLNEDNIN